MKGMYGDWLIRWSPMTGSTLSERPFLKDQPCVENHTCKKGGLISHCGCHEVKAEKTSD